ncbi:MAG TPA: ABC transporter ATP-binding protein [Terriglobia bacterium]|nr:ABC transporter ATP-binding protein [Terriglobia bacterium]
MSSAAPLELKTFDGPVAVDGVSKKFCRRLKTSLAYGLRDISRDLLGLNRKGHILRPGEFWSLDDVTFRLEKGESMGLVGTNGAGKTTLLRVLSGLFRPDKGSVRIRGRLAPLIALGAGFRPVLSGRENIYVNLSILGMALDEIEARFDEIVAFSELEEAIDAPLQTYSSGMAARLGFSCAIHTEPDILLIDEVLGVGDLRFRTKCYRRLAELRRRGTAFLLVSHSPTAILGSCDRCIYMDRGKIVELGETSYVMRRYEEDLRKVPAQAPGRTGLKAAASAVIADGFKMEDIYFTGGDGSKIETPVCGEPVSLHIRCFCLKEFSKIKTTIIVREAFGDLQTVLTLSSGEVPLTLHAGPNEIVLSLPFLGLQTGLYTTKIGLTTNMLEHVAAIESFRFNVGQNERTQHCLFYQPCEWKVTSGPEAKMPALTQPVSKRSM